MTPCLIAIKAQTLFFRDDVSCASIGFFSKVVPELWSKILFYTLTVMNWFCHLAKSGNNCCFPPNEQPFSSHAETIGKL